MKQVMFTLLVLFNINQVFAQSCDSFRSQFSTKQFNVLSKSYHYGLAYDMENTLAALAWTESSAGLFLGSGDPAYGVYQAYIPTVVNRLNLKYDPIVHNLLKEELKNNEAFYTAHAISEVLFWKKRRDIWWNTWASYNGGYRYDKYYPQQYAKKIFSRIKVIKKCAHLFIMPPTETLNNQTFALVKKYTGEAADYSNLNKFIDKHYSMNFLYNPNI